MDTVNANLWNFWFDVPPHVRTPDLLYSITREFRMPLQSAIVLHAVWPIENG